MTSQPDRAPVHVVRPDAPAKAGVVVVQEAFGVTEHILAVAQRLADAGYLAVVPELFWRTTSTPFGPDQWDQIRPAMAALQAGEIDADMKVAFEALQDGGVPPERTGVVGFCMGGSVALATAVGHALGAAVTFYGGGLQEGRFGYPPLIDLAAGLRTPWLGLFGENDASIPPDQVELLREAARRAEVPSDVVLYPEAGHAFHNDTRPDVYVPGAAVDAWGRTMEWFAEHLQ